MFEATPVVCRKGLVNVLGLLPTSENATSSFHCGSVLRGLLNGFDLKGDLGKRKQQSIPATRHSPIRIAFQNTGLVNRYHRGQGSRRTQPAEVRAVSGVASQHGTLGKLILQSLEKCHNSFRKVS